MPTRYTARIEGVEHEVEVTELTALSYRVKVAGVEHNLDLRRVGPASFSILVCDRCFDLDVVRNEDELVVTSRATAIRVALVDKRRRAQRDRTGRRHDGGRAEVKAMMPGRIVNVLVQPGDEVSHQQGLVVVEAMKMENELKSPKAGKIVEVRVSPGQTVEKGELLVIIE
jgi:biotin carboxyl carrier protein